MIRWEDYRCWAIRLPTVSVLKRRKFAVSIWEGDTSWCRPTTPRGVEVTYNGGSSG